MKATVRFARCRLTPFPVHTVQVHGSLPSLPPFFTSSPISKGLPLVFDLPKKSLVAVDIRVTKRLYDWRGCWGGFVFAELDFRYESSREKRLALMSRLRGKWCPQQKQAT